jgi:hypothetical protein
MHESSSPLDDLRMETPIAEAEEKSLWRRLKSYLNMIKTKRGMAVVAGLIIMPIIIILWLAGVFKGLFDDMATKSDTTKPEPTNEIFKFIVSHHARILTAIIILTVVVAASLAFYYYKRSKIGMEEKKRTLVYGIVFSMLLLLVMLGVFVVVLGRKYSISK